LLAKIAGELTALHQTSGVQTPKSEGRMEGERERGREAENGCRMGMTMEGRKEMRRDERTNLQFKPQCGILDTPV